MSVDKEDLLKRHFQILNPYYLCRAQIETNYYTYTHLFIFRDDFLDVNCWDSPGSPNINSFGNYTYYRLLPDPTITFTKHPSQ